MKTIKNELGALSLRLLPTVKAECPISQSFYSAQLTIDLVPDELIPDFVDLTLWLRQNIDNRRFSIEELIVKVKGELESALKPKRVKVAAYVKDASAHFPALVSTGRDEELVEVGETCDFGNEVAPALGESIAKVLDPMLGELHSGITELRVTINEAVQSVKDMTDAILKQGKKEPKTPA